MFVLKQRKIGGYEYAEKTFYSAHHLGTDYTAKTGTPLYAPFDGVVEKIMTGTEGGKTIWFKPDNANVLMRFMHLDEFRCKVGKVKEGDTIALTGNTGKMTKAPHLHLDISKGYLKLGDFSNFLDPEKYKWETQKIDPEIPKIEETDKVPPVIEKPTTTQPVNSQSDIAVDQPIKEQPKVSFWTNLINLIKWITKIG
jgi:hypothetical protein